EAMEGCGILFSVRSYCFCFQAEDGIRDFHVTGVQTCALPILTYLLSRYAENLLLFLYQLTGKLSGQSVQVSFQNLKIWPPYTRSRISPKLTGMFDLS